MSIITKPYMTAKSLHSYNPIPGGCVLYLPLWNPGCWGSTFKSIDSYGHAISRTGGVMNGNGFTVDGDDFMTATSPLFAGTKDTTKKTICYWVYTPNSTLYGNGLSVRDAGGCNWQIYRANNIYNLYIYDGGAGSQDANYLFVQNTWAFIAVIIDGVADEWKIYAARSTEASLTNTYTWASKDFGADDGGGVLNIGRDGAGGFNTSGTFREVWMGNTRLTVPELTYYFNETKGRI